MIKANTEIQVESAQGIREVSLETKLMEERRIFLTGEINMDMANDFVRQMMYLDNGTGEEINIYINSVGGEVMAGLLIYDVIQASGSPINIICIGRAYSMAAILLASGKMGRRFILPHSEVMIHEPLISGGMGGSASSIKKMSDMILGNKDLIVNILEKHILRSAEEIEEAIKYDNYMKPDEAIEFGLCDSIIRKLY